MTEPMEAMTVSCIICGEALENVIHEEENLPHKATCFRAYGQYGSCAFDPMTGHFLEINICDDCLEAAAKVGRVLLGRSARRNVETNAATDVIPRKEQRLTLWDGSEPEDDEEGVRRRNEFYKSLL